MPFDSLLFLAAFGGGAFGAAIGGVFSFVLCGAATMIGAAIVAATPNGDFAALIANGPMLLPAVAFGGAAGAAAYAARRGKFASGRDITTPLIGLNQPDVLLVGGAFGMLGYLLIWGFAQVSPIGDLAWTNTGAAAVLTGNLIVRLLFGRSGLTGRVAPGEQRWRPSERANWVRWQADPAQQLVLSLTFGLGATYSALKAPELVGIWFGVAAFALILGQMGFKAPVWHHIVLAAEQAVALGGGGLLWGVTFALFSGLVGEISARVFYAHGDTHIDPPAVALALAFTLTAALRAAGVFALGDLTALPALALVLTGFGGLSWLQRRGQPTVSLLETA
jgi:hypothetical protein